MGNDASSHDSPSSPKSLQQCHALGNGEGYDIDVMPLDNLLPPMVLIVETMLCSSNEAATRGVARFFTVLLDGGEVGRGTSCPSPSIRVAPIRKGSVVTLRFFAGREEDEQGFLQKALRVPQVAEITLPVRALIMYGAPLYTSFWLGLPSSEESAISSCDVGQALECARSPDLPKVLVTFMKPRKEVRAMPSFPLDASKQSQLQLCVPQPDIQAVFLGCGAEESWEACLGPSPVPQQLVPTEQQVRGLVEALRLAVETASAWQSAIFCADFNMVKDSGRLSPPRMSTMLSDAASQELQRLVDSLQHQLMDTRALHSSELSRLQDEARLQEQMSNRQLAAANDRQAELQAAFEAARAEEQMSTRQLVTANRQQAELQAALEAAQIEVARRKKEEFDNDKESSAAASAASAGRQELKFQLATAKKEVQRLQEVERQQQETKAQLEHATAKVQTLLTIEQKHQEELQQSLLQAQKRERSLQEENAALQSFRAEVGEDYNKLTRKLENATKESMKFKQEQQEHEALKVKFQMLKDDNNALRREREAWGSAHEESLHAKFEALRQQVDSMQVERESLEQDWQAQLRELQAANAELMEREAALQSQQYVPMGVHQALQEKLSRVEKSAEEDQRNLQAKLAQVDDLLAARLNDFDDLKESPTPPRPEVPPGVPFEEYQNVQMKFKESEQAREVLSAHLERLAARLHELEERVNEPPSSAPPTPVHERPLAKKPSGVPVEDYESLVAELEQARSDSKHFEELATKAQQLHKEKSVSVEDYEALQRKLDKLQQHASASSASPAPSAPAQEVEALQAKLDKAEKERQKYMEVARSQDFGREQMERTSRQLQDAQRKLAVAEQERDDMEVQLMANKVRNQQQESAETASIVAAAVERERETFQMRENSMIRDMEALQHELSAVLRNLDEVKHEKQALDTSLARQQSASDLSASGRRSLPGPSRSSSQRKMSTQDAEEVILREGEKTVLGAKVSELRLAMKKKETAHKEDISKLNKELMSARAIGKQERTWRLDLEQNIAALKTEAELAEERFRAETLRVSQLSSGDQDLQKELSKLKGEVEVLRLRERQWQAIATGGGDGGSGSIEMQTAKAPGGVLGSKSDSYVLRLFHRLIWEKFCHFNPDDLAKALKMDQRPATMPKSEVEKVLKLYRNHQKNFSMAKAFRGLDVHRSGRLAAHEFELRLTQALQLDVELSGHIYNLLKSVMLHSADGTSGSCADSTPRENAASSACGETTPKEVVRRQSSTGSSRSLKSTTPPGSRADTSRSLVEADVIREEEFAQIFEFRKY